jgi:phosphoglycolate phosphatase-like HAD superfamily hydrolase
MLFFDLDGPLLDVSPRYVALHQALLAGSGVSPMAGPLYWECKRTACPEETILAQLGVRDATAYLRRRLDLIETTEYLAHDRPWPWVHAVLARLAVRSPLVLVTARACRPLLLEQLDRLALAPFFHEILSEPAGRRVDQQKAALIRDCLDRHGRGPAGCWMVGDTQADVSAGRLAGLRTVAVLCGIRDRDLLQRAGPDFLLEDIRELPLIVEAPPETGDELRRTQPPAGTPLCRNAAAWPY